MTLKIRKYGDIFGLCDPHVKFMAPFSPIWCTSASHAAMLGMAAQVIGRGRHYRMRGRAQAAEVVPSQNGLESEHQNSTAPYTVV